jgi:ketosteroid isomerase-like protein
MSHPNEELTRRGFDAFAKGDVDTLRKLFAVWHVPGRNQLSGDHRGVDTILGSWRRRSTRRPRSYGSPWPSCASSPAVSTR